MNHERRVALIHLGQKTFSARHIRQQLELAGLQVTEAAVETAADADNVRLLLSEDVAVLNLGDCGFDPSVVIEALSQAYGNDRLIINDALIVDTLTGWERKRWLRHLLNKIDPAYSLLPEPAMEPAAEEKIWIAGVQAVWVLAASIGGPEAIREFLQAMPAQVPALFILAQHMSSDFQPMLREQLAASTALAVEIPWPGMALHAGQVVLAPPREKLLVTPTARVDLQPDTTTSVLTPSIDAVCEQALAQFPVVHMAVFSGMSTDGVAGAQQVTAAGGRVIVQTPESTVVDSIIQGVKSRLTPDFEGHPQTMARYVTETFNE